MHLLAKEPVQSRERYRKTHIQDYRGVRYESKVKSFWVYSSVSPMSEFWCKPQHVTSRMPRNDKAGTVEEDPGFGNFRTTSSFVTEL